MPIIVTCECGKQFQTSDANAGSRSQCPACGRDLIIPKAEFDPDATAPLILEEFTPRTSGKAIASLVLGILSLFCTFFTGLPAIILGHPGAAPDTLADARFGAGSSAQQGRSLRLNQEIRQIPPLSRLHGEENVSPTPLRVAS